MQENKEYSLTEIAQTIKDFSGYLLKRWWILMMVVAASASLGIVYYNKQKPKYEAVTTFLLEEKSSGGSGLAGLASQFGVNVGGLGGGGSMFAGDNILNILKSKNVVHKVLLRPITDNPKVKTKTVADLYLEFTGLKNAWQKEKLLAEISFSNSNGQLNAIQDSVLNIIHETVIKKCLAIDKISKLGSIIKVQVTSENSQFSRLVSKGLVEEAAKLYDDIKTGTAIILFDGNRRS